MIPFAPVVRLALVFLAFLWTATISTRFLVVFCRSLAPFTTGNVSKTLNLLILQGFKEFLYTKWTEKMKILKYFVRFPVRMSISCEQSSQVHGEKDGLLIILLFSIIYKHTLQGSCWTFFQNSEAQKYEFSEGIRRVLQHI